LSCGEEGSLARKMKRPRAEPDVKVLVVDDQDSFRSVLCELVGATSGFAVVGEATCGEEALHVIRALSPEFVLMDVRMPGLGGIEAARVMMERDPHLVVLLVSAQELPDLARDGFSELPVSFAHKRNLGGGVLREVWEGRDESGERSPLGARH
jgi:two-component system, NarL family, invasion response regulator UvrY